MAKVVQFEQYGNPEVLTIVHRDRSEPGRDEVEVNVKAIGLNRAEAMFRSGNYLENADFPSSLGYEASGIITRLGKEVQDLKVGDHVSLVPPESISKWGTYREYATLPASNLVINPDGFSHVEAASIWMQYLTACGGLVKYGHVGVKQYVLITAASSSVGIAAIQLVRYLGAIPIAVTRTLAKSDALKKVGAEAVISLDQGSLGTQLKALGLDGAIDLVFDAVGGRQLNELCQVLKYEGKIVLYGALSQEPAEFSMLVALQKCIELKAFVLHELIADADQLDTAKARLLEALENKELIPVIDKVFDFDDVVAAHRYMEAGSQFGKIVLKA